jgi:hypothetical protein
VNEFHHSIRGRPPLVVAPNLNQGAAVLLAAFQQPKIGTSCFGLDVDAETTLYLLPQHGPFGTDDKVEDLPGGFRL